MFKVVRKWERACTIGGTSHTTSAPLIQRRLPTGRQPYDCFAACRSVLKKSGKLGEPRPLAKSQPGVAG
jgi:hypothetical protein